MFLVEKLRTEPSIPLEKVEAPHKWPNRSSWATGNRRDVSKGAERGAGFVARMCAAVALPVMLCQGQSAVGELECRGTAGHGARNNDSLDRREATTFMPACSHTATVEQ